MIGSESGSAVQADADGLAVLAIVCLEGAVQPVGMRVVESSAIPSSSLPVLVVVADASEVDLVFAITALDHAKTFVCLLHPIVLIVNVEQSPVIGGDIAGDLLPVLN